jgi:hypothetical protein
LKSQHTGKRVFWKERQATKKQKTKNKMGIHSPTIINQTQQTIVVYQERGTLFNGVVLHPGEAVTMTRTQTGGMPLIPYYVHAVIGDEKALPDQYMSHKNLLKASIVPTAFVMGAFMTAMAAGTLMGPAAALAPLVSGAVINGVVIDAAAIAAGTLAAAKVATVSEFLVEKHSDKFMTKSGALRPGERYIVVRGGIDTSLQLVELSSRAFKKLKLNIESFKVPLPP